MPDPPLSLLPAGPDLVRWIRAGGRPARGGSAALWAYRWRGYWFGKNLKMQQALRRETQFRFEHGRNLVLVLGLWRSGTTLLHELLASIEGVAYPQTWQCMNPSAFLLQAQPARSQTITRPMDAVKIDAFSPQEDEFFLLAAGYPSVYRSFVDPRRWAQTVEALSQATWESDSLPWMAPWLQFLSDCAPADARILAVKSPNHLFRLRSLRRALPEVAEAWVLRDPEAAWQSNRKMWSAMAATYALWPPGATDLDDLLAACFSEYAETLEWALTSGDGTRRCVVRFEDLAADPSAQAPQIVRALGLDDLALGARRIPPASPPGQYVADAELIARHGSLFERIRQGHAALHARYA